MVGRTKPNTNPTAVEGEPLDSAAMGKGEPETLLEAVFTGRGGKKQSVTGILRALGEARQKRMRKKRPVDAATLNQPMTY